MYIPVELSLIIVFFFVLFSILLFFTLRGKKEKEKQIDELKKQHRIDLENNKISQNTISLCKQEVNSLNIKLSTESNKNSVLQKNEACLQEELRQTNNKLESMLEKLRVYEEFYHQAQSNLTLFPYMAGIVAELERRDIELLAKKLDWGQNVERAKKVASISSIRKEAKEKIEQAKEAEYKLAYLLQLYPALQDIIEYDYSELPTISQEKLSERDPAKDYLTQEEWEKLSRIEKNQLALDRYIQSKRKTNWQIGRDYEEFVGYCFREKGFQVENHGSFMGLDDLGRDVIAKKGKKTYIIQCKYWSSNKEIHENHINQLFGTITSYGIEYECDPNTVLGYLITNTQLSDTAKEFAARLHIHYIENFKLGKYPRVKCNIRKDSCGETKIYHLPFDQQYDSTKICNPGEFYAFSVREAEEAGFRRAYKWFGSNN